MASTASTFNLPTGHGTQAISDAEVWQRLRDASKQVPRFLFRPWRPSARIDTLNTTHAITPAAFIHGGGPASNTDLTIPTLANLWQTYLAGDDSIDTVFSCWTSSLDQAIEQAIEPTADGEMDGHVSVVDTKRLPARLPAFYTFAPGIRDLAHLLGDKGHLSLYLIFGPISGPAHSAVSIASIRHLHELRLGSALNDADPYMADPTNEDEPAAL
ncbi:hypothetical protein LTR53_017254, partial [Teratosphaeriaceae sp. CCFEE 6253]